ncbi:MAG: hypothetical protein R3B90_02520 [Planctomycetaceae bacterium]
MTARLAEPRARDRAFNVGFGSVPDQFRRVLSTIGTYVDLRGGGEFPTMIRKFEPKPIRVFLQDGSNDLNLYAGSWWHANQSMLSALQFAGYDVHHLWGEGGHDAAAARCPGDPRMAMSRLSCSRSSPASP